MLSHHFLEEIIHCSIGCHIVFLEPDGVQRSASPRLADWTVDSVAVGFGKIRVRDSIIDGQDRLKVHKGSKVRLRCGAGTSILDGEEDDRLRECEQLIT